MTVAKVSLSLDEDVVAEARSRAGRRELSAYVNEAVRQRLQHDRIAEFLAEAEAAAGPIPATLLQDARQVWRADGRSSRRRSG